MYLKQWIIILFTSCFSLLGEAQNVGIHFQDTTWSVLLAEARSAHKLIFLDAYASWCGPCKWMKRNIFPLKKVGEIYNRNFINTSINMEKAEGIKISKQYNISAYPTFLYVNGDGKIVNKTVGECKADEFIQNGLDALSPTRNLNYLIQNYDTHLDDYSYISIYLNSLKEASEPNQANLIATDYLGKQPKPSWLFPDNWKLINEYVIDATSSPFRYIVAHQNFLDNKYGSMVDKKIYNTYLAWPQHYLQYPKDNNPQLDEKGFRAFISQVKNSHYTKKKEIIAKAKLTIYFGLHQWKSYAATVNQMLKDKVIPWEPTGAGWLYSYANDINMFSKDSITLTSAMRWARIIAKEIPGISPDNKATYMDLYATLLEKNGKGKESILIRKQINQSVLTRAKENAPFQALQIVPKSKEEK